MSEPEFVSELYGAYAAGRLSPAYELLLQTQSAIRADIAADIMIGEAAAGAMLEREEGVLLSPNAFETALRAIEDSEDESERIVHFADNSDSDELDSLPEPLRDCAISALQDTGWRKLKKGVSRLDLSQNTHVRAHLYRIEPGACVPHHTHHGDEYTLVIKGGFSDQNGSFGPGDICRQTPLDHHSPVADEDGVCLALAVSEGGMKFTGLLGLVQRISGQ